MRRRKSFVWLWIILLFLGVCAAGYVVIADSIGAGSTATAGADPVADDTQEPDMTVVPTEVLTNTPTAKATATLVPTVTRTSTPVPTTTPEGRTELGGYVEDIATDLGFTSVQFARFSSVNGKIASSALPYSISIAGEKIYTSVYMEGYELDAEASGYLVVSLGYWNGGSALRANLGYGFSIYQGTLSENCQGVGQINTPSQALCMGSFLVEATQSTTTPQDEYGFYWAPFVVYPLNETQLKVLLSKYSLSTYPLEHHVMIDEWEKYK